MVLVNTGGIISMGEEKMHRNEYHFSVEKNNHYKML
jgi:hypothetical protein